MELDEPQNEKEPQKENVPNNVALSDHSIDKILQTKTEEPPPTVLRLRRKRRLRTTFPKEAVRHLEKVFAVNPYPGITEREELAQLLQVPESRVHVWFQNKRSRQKRVPPDVGPSTSNGQNNRLTTATSADNVKGKPRAEPFPSRLEYRPVLPPVVLNPLINVHPWNVSTAFSPLTLLPSVDAIRRHYFL